MQRLPVVRVQKHVQAICGMSISEKLKRCHANYLRQLDMKGFICNLVVYVEKLVKLVTHALVWTEPV